VAKRKVLVMDIEREVLLIVERRFEMGQESGLED
jgi:hypothetical protein